MTPTKEQFKAAIMAITALAEAIRELGEVPSSELYTRVMGHMNLDTYESFINRLVEAEVVQRKGHMLKWIGPKID
jgi:hypothetical protein